MTLTLRPYQQQLKNNVYSEWHVGARNVIAVMPTGAGKTAVMADIFHDMAGRPCVAIAHRQELVSQISMAFARAGIVHNVIAPSAVIQFCIQQHIKHVGRNYHHAKAPIAVAGVQTVLRRGAKMEQWCNSVEMWAQDECFPAGTMISTAAGETPIEQISIGDIVLSFNEKSGSIVERRVNRLYRKEMPENMVRLTTKHHVLTCTLNHPIWTQRGWVNAGEIRTDDVLHVRQISESDTLLEDDRSGFLHKRLQQGVTIDALVGNDGENQSQVRKSSHERTKSYAESAISRENASNDSSDGASAFGARRERETSHRSREDACELVFSDRVSKSICGSNRSSGPKPLQDRLRTPAIKDSDRSGRGIAPVGCKTTIGREEGRIFVAERVASVQVFKREDIEKSERRYVYNFEVNETHTYVANGIIVHNCHHVLPQNSWGKAAALFPRARGLGVTATPIRCDKKPLGRQHGGMFDAMVIGPTMRDLIDQGHLTEYRMFAPPQSIDTDKVAVSDSTGDFNQHSLREEAHKSTITGDIVEHYLRIAPGKRGITFTVDVEQAKETSARFNAAGVPAEAVSAKTPDAIRQKSIEAFSRGDIRQLVNVDLFGEGFDVPAVEVVSKGRPTQSYPLDQQQSGRALRPFPGKDAGIIIDHVGNWKRHGLPDQHRVWSLDMQEIRKGRPRSDDELPLTSCVECFRPYVATKRICPHCGHMSEPVSRGAPEYVDGDLIEFSPELLAKLRGDVERIETGSPLIPYGATGPIKKRLENLWQERQNTLQELRDCINLWAGIENHVHGKSDSEAYRKFYFFFGVDVLTAQTLPAPDMRKLTEEIRLTFTDTT